MEAYLADRRTQLGLLEKSIALVDYTVESKEIQLDSQFDDLKPAILKLDDYGRGSEPFTRSKFGG